MKSVKQKKTEADVSSGWLELPVVARKGGLCGHAKRDTDSVTGGLAERKYL